MKTALITGIRGQDGAYLAQLLLSKGYKVYGADRRSADGYSWRLEYLGIQDQVEIKYMDLLELPNVIDIIKELQPDEIYNLAAQSFVGVSFNQPLVTSQINAIGVLNLLEAIRHYSPESKFYQASTSEMFGGSTEVLNENSEFKPKSPYATAKLFAHNSVINYRESFDLFACCGILFNHESPLRGFEFVTRKITDGIARIKLGLADKLILGNLEAQRDWGYAPEYVNAMWLMLQQDKPDDFAIATNTTVSIKTFIDHVCAEAGCFLEWQGSGKDLSGIIDGKISIEISDKFYRPNDVEILKGDATKAHKILNWKPETFMPELVKIMYQADFERLSKQ